MLWQRIWQPLTRDERNEARRVTLAVAWRRSRWAHHHGRRIGLRRRWIAFRKRTWFFFWGGSIFQKVGVIHLESLEPGPPETWRSYWFLKNVAVRLRPSVMKPKTSRGGDLGHRNSQTPWRWVFFNIHLLKDVFFSHGKLWVHRRVKSHSVQTNGWNMFVFGREGC